MERLTAGQCSRAGGLFGVLFGSLTFAYGIAQGGSLPEPAQGPGSRAVDREFLLRRAACESIELGQPLTVLRARAALGEAAAPAWVLDLEARLAAVRFDVAELLPGPIADEPPGSVAARIALLENRGEEAFQDELLGALGSPFGAVRAAGFRRLARESAAKPQWVREVLRRLRGSPASGAAQVLDPKQADPTADLSVSLGLGACLDYGLETRVLLARFKELIALPISARALERLRSVEDDPAGAQALADLFGLVLAARLGQPASLGEASIERLCRAEHGEPLGAALEAMSEEARRVLLLPEFAGFTGRRTALEDAGNGLIRRAMELDPTGAAPSPALLAGLRIIPAPGAFRWAFDWSLKLPGEAGEARDAGEAGAEAFAIADESTAPVAPEVLAPFLEDPEHPLFGDAFWILGRRFAHGGEAALEPLLRGQLALNDEDFRLHAFGWLAGAGKGSDQALRRAFDEAGAGSNARTDLQRLYLRELDRRRAHPEFEDVVLAELAAARAPEVSALDLAAGLRSGEAVRSALKQRLEREAEAIVNGPTFEKQLAHDGVASQLAQALGSQGLAEIERALLDTMELLHPMANGAAEPEGSPPKWARPSLPKVAVKILAASDPARVARYLDAGVPRRVRVEAALQIAGRSRDGELLKRASQVLVGAFDGVDGSLQLASIRALCKLPRSVEPKGLGEFALSVMERRGTAVGIAAVDLLAARAMTAPLAEAVSRALNNGGAPGDEAAIETALAAARHLAGLPGGETPAFEMLGAIEARVFRDGAQGGGVPGPGQDHSWLLDLRGELLVGLVKAAPGGPSLAAYSILGRVLRAPLEAAREDLERRFAGEDQLKAEFRWKSELECFGILDRSVMSRAVLDLPRGWWRIDGRLLAALGSAVGSGSPTVPPGTAARLLRMGLFAMEGERDSRDLPLRLCAARLAYVAQLRDDALPDGAGGGPRSPAGRARRIRRLREIARVEVDIAADLRSGAVRAGVLGAAYGRTPGIESMGIPGGDPGEAPQVYALAGLRAAASMHEYLSALGAEEADPASTQRAEQARATWEQWRQLLGGRGR